MADDGMLCPLWTQQSDLIADEPLLDQLCGALPKAREKSRDPVP